MLRLHAPSTDYQEAKMPNFRSRSQQRQKIPCYKHAKSITSHRLSSGLFQPTYQVISKFILNYETFVGYRYTVSRSVDRCGRHDDGSTLQWVGIAAYFYAAFGSGQLSGIFSPHFSSQPSEAYGRRNRLTSSICTTFFSYRFRNNTRPTLQWMFVTRTHTRPPGVGWLPCWAIIHEIHLGQTLFISNLLESVSPKQFFQRMLSRNKNTSFPNVYL